MNGQGPRPPETDGAGGVLIAGPPARALHLADELRAAGRRAAVDLVGLSGDALTAYARRWGFSDIVRLKDSRARKGASRKEKEE